MQVFKNYLKVMKSYVPMILIYTLIFVGIAAMTTLSGNQTSSAFETSKAKIALINHDENSEFIQSFEQYIKDNADYVKLEDKEDVLRDALFFRKVDYIMIVPKDFTNDFLNNKDVLIETMEVPDSYDGVYSKTLMNKYLNTAKLYLKTDIPIQEITQHIQKDLSIHTEVEMNTQVVDDRITNVSTFYNFANYTLLSIIIVVISMVMISFRDEKIHRRNLISRTTYKSLNRQLLLGNIVSTIGVWLLYVISSIILYQEVMFTNSGLLIILNSFVLTIFILVFSFFLTSLTQKREVVSGISTVVGLGTSFISGAFVPQEFLSPAVLSISKLTPSYWYITNNNLISKTTDFSWTGLQPVFMNMVVILGFAIVFYILIQLTSRLRLKK
ncbi:MAG: ABC transporter permease [Coprobacillus sp.]